MPRPSTAGGTQSEARPPRWPSVEEQLAAAKVIHGSALEKLIRDNQDFSVLRPEEANDKLRLPPWLRVYWRKQHPDGFYAGPSGGYPLVLRELLEWMIVHQDLPQPEVPAEPLPPTPPRADPTRGSRGPHGQ